MLNTEPYKSLLNYIPENELILDAGCGHFTYANFLENYNDEILCLDISNLNMTEARKHDFLLASVKNLPFKDNSFNFIYCLSVIQFIENDREVINEFCRILKPKGRLLFTVPTSISAFRLLRDLEIMCGLYKYPEFNIKNHHYYTIGKIQRLVNKKFKLIDLHGYNYNFIPRLLAFLTSFFKLDSLLIHKNISVSKKMKGNHGQNKYINKKSFINFDYLPKIFSEFSYQKKV